MRSANKASRGKVSLFLWRAGTATCSLGLTSSNDCGGLCIRYCGGEHQVGGEKSVVVSRDREQTGLFLHGGAL